jgi:endonuclease YncB( thermonuclease family)
LEAGSRGVQVIRVIDGDTFVIAGGEHVRILNIDTAEMPPHSRCGEEERLALAATSRMRALTSSARTVTLTSTNRDRDRYGRLLRLVRIDGRDVGEVLISEGLAQRWAGHKADWC